MIVIPCLLPVLSGSLDMLIRFPAGLLNLLFQRGILPAIEPDLFIVALQRAQDLGRGIRLFRFPRGKPEQLLDLRKILAKNQGAHRSRALPQMPGRILAQFKGAELQ